MSFDEAVLHGQTALVTGSSSGIGAAVARRMAAQGATVAVHARTSERAEPVAEAIRQAGGQSVVVTADLSDPAQAAGLIDRAAAELGGLSILVNNAGASSIAPSLEVQLEDWNRILALNLTAPFLCAQAAGRIMCAAGEGVIVNIGSAFGHVGIPGRAAYCTVKHGIVGLTRVLATEWAEHGVRVVSVDPGVIMTELVEANRDAGRIDLDRLTARIPVRKLGTPGQIAEVVAFAASPAASYLTGASVPVDGGWTAFGGWT